jgi:hypothetical protein
MEPTTTYAAISAERLPETFFMDNREEMETLEDTTVGCVCESIETNLWQAEAYFSRGERGIAVECLREAWMEYVRFSEILKVYDGEALGRQLVQALVERAGDAAEQLALGPEPEAESLRMALAAA